MGGGLSDEVWKARRESFDTIAARYDAARPSYPAAVFDELESRLDAMPARILEVGSGPGKATVDLAARGHVIHALEPGASLAALARENLAAYPDVTVEVATLEDAEVGAGAYDVVFAAASWHWVDPWIGYAKAATALRPGGLLALVANAYTRGGTQALVADEIREVYAREAPELTPKLAATVDDVRAIVDLRADVATLWSSVDRRTAGRDRPDPPDTTAWFGLPDVLVHPWIATLTRDAYLDLIATGSAYLRVYPDGGRSRALDRIGELIDDRLGGTITKEFVTILATATRRDGAV